MQQQRTLSARLKQSLWTDSTLLAGSLMLGNVLAQVYQMLTSRLLSPSEYGALVTLTAISYVLAVVIRTFEAWVIKAVSEAHKSGIGSARTVFDAAMRTLVPLGIIAFALTWLGSNWIAEFLHLPSTVPVVLLGLFAFSSILLPVAAGLLMGLNRLRAASVAIVTEPVFRVLAGTALVLGGAGVSGAMFGYSAGNFAAFAVGLIPLWAILRHRRTKEGSVRLGSLDHYSILGLAINSLLMGIGSIDQVAVKHYFADEVAGNYAVAFLLGRVISTSTMALSWVIFTRSAAMADDDPARLGLVAKWVGLIGGLGIACTAIYSLAPNLVVWIMGGSQYKSAQDYVSLVGIETTLFSLVYIQAYYLMSVRKMQVIFPIALAGLASVSLLVMNHESIQSMLWSLIAVMSVLLAVISAQSWRTLGALGRKRAVAGEARVAAEHES